MQLVLLHIGNIARKHIDDFNRTVLYFFTPHQIYLLLCPSFFCFLPPTLNMFCLIDSRWIFISNNIVHLSECLCELVLCLGTRCFYKTTMMFYNKNNGATRDLKSMV
ncbi:hypothetical protein BCR42DRAFT_410695 [Absidia repens]|uniref:Uncharacterized protein n=1 Tax=Absidia repens TaxID=90262 RepID=A0A1X2IQV7_9FUNG|nr:hypothetical protein BCR42DRAFT_410695 [Absidia repens]